jgi:hypothetical protein
MRETQVLARIHARKYRLRQRLGRCKPGPPSSAELKSAKFPIDKPIRESPAEVAGDSSSRTRQITVSSLPIGCLGGGSKARSSRLDIRQGAY